VRFYTQHFNKKKKLKKKNFRPDERKYDMIFILSDEALINIVKDNSFLLDSF